MKKSVFSRKTPKNIFTSIVFNGVKIYSVGTESRIHSKVDGELLCCVDKYKLYGYMALCGELSMCLAILILRTLLNGTPLISIVGALLLFFVTLAICFFQYKAIILSLCIKHKASDKNSSAMLQESLDTEEDNRPLYMMFIGAMILYNFFVILS